MHSAFSSCANATVLLRALPDVIRHVLYCLNIKICYVADFDKIFNVVLFSASSEIFPAVCKALPIGICFDGLGVFWGGNMNSDDRLTSKLHVVFVVCFYTAEFKFARLSHAVLLTCIKLV